MTVGKLPKELKKKIKQQTMFEFAVTHKISLVKHGSVYELHKGTKANILGLMKDLGRNGYDVRFCKQDGFNCVHVGDIKK